MSLKFDDNTMVERNPRMLFHEIDGEVVMLDPESGRYHGLNLIGSRIWELTEKKIEFKKLIEILMNEFDVSIDQCKSDVLEFLEELYNKKLIIVYSNC